MKAQGFTGSLNLVQRHVKSWRETSRGQSRPHREEPPSSRTVAWWLLGHFRQEADLRQNQAAFVERLCQLCPDIQTAQKRALRFSKRIKERHAEERTQWLDAATSAPDFAQIRFPYTTFRHAGGRWFLFDAYRI